MKDNEVRTLRCGEKVYCDLGRLQLGHGDAVFTPRNGLLLITQQMPIGVWNEFLSTIEEHCEEHRESAPILFIKGGYSNTFKEPPSYEWRTEAEIYLAKVEKAEAVVADSRRALKEKQAECLEKEIHLARLISVTVL